MTEEAKGSFDEAMSGLTDYFGDDAAEPLKSAFDAMYDARVAKPAPETSGQVGVDPSSRSNRTPPGTVGGPPAAPPTGPDNDTLLVKAIRAGDLGAIERLSGKRYRGPDKGSAP